MSFFCLLWVPFFYIFRRSFSNSGGGSVFALLFGSMTAVIQFLLGDLVNPGGFGFSRWIYGFIDIVSLPVLFPVIIYTILLVLRKSSGGNADFAGFTLFWLIPVGALRALSWSAERDPLLLVAVPLLWTALAAGIAFLIHLMMESYSTIVKIGYFLCILLLPVFGALAYWAFFSQQALLGFLFFIITQIPLGLSFVLKT
ncbi:MAG: hypothetical protein LBU88_05170 [Treponema sp.]|jgi:hypothetical protein|nr:hypothetical protein [Treponema sp.]